jgi:hypothetical protein
MAIIKKQDIRGYRFENRIVCTDCVTEDDLKSMKEDELILDALLEQSKDAFYFCDECKKLLS